MFKSDLWKTSGHWDHYADGMFTFEVEKEQFGLKPMNCPGHCKLFAHSDVSYRDLPWRVADFGVLHRNEFSGALSGLTRVRRFCQDDAHHFCSADQIGDEIGGIFDFLDCVYGLCGFKYKLKLSTRPEKFIGDISIWDEAESKLKGALDKFTAAVGGSWEEKPGDGAFYGPKIDIQLSDASAGSTNAARSSLTSIFHAASNFATWPRRRAIPIPTRLEMVVMMTCQPDTKGPL